MKGFNSPLTSKEQLEKYTKEQLVDMLFESSENIKRFTDWLVKASPEEIEDMKLFFKIIKMS